MHLNILGIHILDCNNNVFHDDDFVSLARDKNDMNIRFAKGVFSDFKKFSYGITYISPKILSSSCIIFFSETKERVAMIAVDDTWTRFKIFTDSSHYTDSINDEAIQELILVGFYSYMSLRQTLLMHASAVSWNGQGLVFTAPSGTGKTTQAELWARYKGAKILNGDKVFLKQEADAIHAWGSPWKGSSPYALNESAPLKAIIVLRQAKENSIRRLTTLEAMELFVPHVFFPKWDEKCEQAVLDFLDVVMSQTPIYLLCCRPDEEAVELTERTIFGESQGEPGGESNEK